ncbi:hypothetical protein BWI17_00955 [Betaproteobacteria bacterium GR16-43]|nr:hypothetical protein BWI17_00955 [Betaproteobacteria bacterium GR16-43]
MKPLVLALALAAAGPAAAYQFKMDNGITANVDTTLSYGAAFRAQGAERQLIGIANGGTTRSVNEDDGDLNYKRDRAFSNAVKATVDVEVKWGRWGFFGRGLAFYDFENADSDKLGPTGKDRLGKDVVGLDGFFSGTFEPMDKKLAVRVGRQVISWGESTFIQNGINVINPVDVSKLRIPGSEVKEALIPTQALWANMELTNALSVEGFYLTNWDKVKLDPKGSYFSTNDAASDDATRVILSFGRRQDEHFPVGNPVPPTIPTLGAAAAALYGPFNPAASLWAPRVADKVASDSGQYGVAFRYLAKDLNSTEFGLYYMNYHSRTPFFSATKGTPTSVLTGGPLIAPICANAALRSLCTTGTANYYTEYPEDIHLTGLSFNTAGPWGVALQGEYSYRSNLPLQYATAELILASLGLPNLITGFTQIPGAATGATAAALVPDGTTLVGYQRVKASQFQTTATKSFPALMGSDTLVLVGEVGANYFHNLPTNVKFAGPAAYLPATAFGAVVASAFSVQDPAAYLTQFSWGYRLAGRMDYGNALYGGTLSPRAAFTHDVNGVGPNFNKDTKSLSFGLGWDYQKRWIVDMQYTTFFGGRTFCGTDVPPAGSAVTPGQPASWCSDANPLRDRDFYSVSVSYAF